MEMIGNISAEANEKHNADLTKKAEARKAAKEAADAKKAEERADNLVLTIEMKKNDYRTLKSALLSGKPLSGSHLKKFQNTVEFLQKHDPQFLTTR